MPADLAFKTDAVEYIHQLGSVVAKICRLSLPGGTFYAWLQKTRGRISGQTKVPRMSEERTVAEGVLALVEHNS